MGKWRKGTRTRQLADGTGSTCLNLCAGKSSNYRFEFCLSHKKDRTRCSSKNDRSAVLIGCRYSDATSRKGLRNNFSKRKKYRRAEKVPQFFKPIKPMKLTSIISKYLDGYGETKKAIEGTGLSRDTINSMKRGGETRISKFIKLANFLGWQIIIRTKDEEIEITE